VTVFHSLLKLQYPTVMQRNVNLFLPVHLRKALEGKKK